MPVLTPNSAFPAGLLDSILPFLSLPIRNQILFNWAHLFSQYPDQDPLIADIISTTSTLDFSSHRSLEPNNFMALANLPLPNLKHLDLSHIPFSEPTHSEILKTISSSPIFDNLESLNLSNTQQRKLDELLSGSNSFPNLTTLNLSSNLYFSVNSLLNTRKLPNLKHLDLSRCNLENYDVNTMMGSNVGFKLESINLSNNPHIRRYVGGFDPFGALFQAPLFATIKDLNLVGTQCDLAALSFLLDDKEGPFARKLAVDPHCQSLQQSRQNDTDVTMGYNQFTRLCLDGQNGIMPLNQKAICDLGSSSTVSHLTQLTLGLDSKEAIDLGVLAKSKYLSNLKELMINFNGNDSSLAHLLDPGDDDFPHFRLEKLEVLWAKLSPDDIRVLNSAPCLSTLKSLSLISCRDKDDGSDRDDDGSTEDESKNLDPFVDLGSSMKLLSQSNIISKLTHLNLQIPHSFPQRVKGLKSLLRSNLLSSDLIELNLRGNQLDAECIEIITSRRVNEGDENSPLKFGKLQKLNLGLCGLEKGALATISKLTELTHLDISSYGGGDNGDDLVHSLIETQDNLPFLPKLANLTHLVLYDSNITNSGAIALSQSQLLNGLVELDLSFNHLDNRGLEALVTTKLVTKLKFLHLRGNAERLTRGIENLPYLGDCQVKK